jgi:hypothetical protein
MTDTLTLPKEIVISAYHEAGHSLVLARTGLAVTKAVVQYKVRGDKDWTAFAKTSFDDTPADDPDALILSVLAGPMAEACWWHQFEGVNLRKACKTSQRRNEGDAKALKGYLRKGTLTERQAVELSLGMVTRGWAGVERIAAELLQRQELSGRQIRRLAG